MKTQGIRLVKRLMKPKFSATFEEALIVVDHLIFANKNRHLSEAEIIVLKGSWNENDYEQIASGTRFSLNYLQRTVAPKLWDMLSETAGTDISVGKKNLRNFLAEIIKKHYNRSEISEKEIFPVREVLPLKGDKPPSFCRFFGRAEELTYLKDLIVRQQCIALLGVAGIGKSALAAKLLAEISVESVFNFNCLIWKSVAHGPLLKDLVSDLIEIIQPQPKESLPEYTQAKISALLKQMQLRRCLLVLDSGDALFQNHEYGSEQRLEYEIFFRRIVEERHQSCLLLLSRSLPREIEFLIEAKRISCLKIEGLDTNAAKQLLSDYGVTDEEKSHYLIQTYRGNPSQLEAVLNRIERFFGNVDQFFEHPTTLISSQLEDVLNKMFGQKLNELQRQIMIYLAEEINSNEKFGFNQILSYVSINQAKSIPASALLAALEDLERESLIEVVKNSATKEVSFNLEPSIKKYIRTDPMNLVRSKA